MEDQRKEFGRHGEDRATAFFISHGFQVVDRNWSCRYGEIDLICEKDGVIHFIEVKTRRSRQYGNPEESITEGKLGRLRRAVESYVYVTQLDWSRVCIDALAILAEPGKTPEYHYIEDIFGG
ncbi:MAG: YraN family protein [bacterium]|nr:YraN family protein [bacterium]